MLKIYSAPNYSTNNKTNFKGKTDYSKIYKEMENMTLRMDEKIVPKTVAKTGFLASATAFLASKFIPKNTSINLKNTMLKRENILKKIDEHGNTFAHIADLKEWKQIYKIYKNDPDMLIKIYTAKNNSGDLPAHCFGRNKAHDSETITSIRITGGNDIVQCFYGREVPYSKDIEKKFGIMNKALKNNLDELGKIYFTQNKAGVNVYNCERRHQVYKALKKNEKLVQDLIFEKDENGWFVEQDTDTVIKYLKNKPDLLAKYFLSHDNRYGQTHLALDLRPKEMFKKMNAIQKALINQPDVLYKIYMTPIRLGNGAYSPLIPRKYRSYSGPIHEKYGKAYLKNIIDLVEGSNLSPIKAKNLLLNYKFAAKPAGLNKKFDELIRYFTVKIIDS